MIPAVGVPEARIVLRNISWETYERLNDEVPENTGTRFAYKHGDLEILVVSLEHEGVNRLLHDLFTAIAVGFDLDFINVGSMTYKRKDLECGFEADTAVYIQNVEAVKGKKRINPSSDPPPDLVIEVDITHASLDKLPILLSVGVPEVWRFDGEILTILKLEDGGYLEVSESSVLPGVSSAKLNEFIDASKTQKRSAWLRGVQEWATKSVPTAVAGGL